jgi:NlpC/P60 family putative phage cell wall peptidase
MTSEAVIAEARTWVGTPFRHQARLKYVGCDCIGLVWGVGEACGVLEVDPVRVKRYLGYGRTPNPARMREALETFFVPLPAGPVFPSDIAWLEWREDLPMHLAVLTERRAGGTCNIIHSLRDVGKVCEHGFTDEWRARVNSWWRYPGLA